MKTFETLVVWVFVGIGVAYSGAVFLAWIRQLQIQPNHHSEILAYGILMGIACGIRVAVRNRRQQRNPLRHRRKTRTAPPIQLALTVTTHYLDLALSSAFFFCRGTLCDPCVSA
jgi:hypothetical protein